MQSPRGGEQVDAQIEDCPSLAVGIGITQSIRGPDTWQHARRCNKRPESMWGILLNLSHLCKPQAISKGWSYIIIKQILGRGAQFSSIYVQRIAPIGQRWKTQNLGTISMFRAHKTDSMSNTFDVTHSCMINSDITRCQPYSAFSYLPVSHQHFKLLQLAT